MAELPIIRMEDVPAEIWNATYDKWHDALETGWDADRLWYGCDLCLWVNKIDHGCSMCPLREGGWCNNMSHKSKLHYNYDSSCYGCVLTPWNKRVKNFLDFIKSYCTGNRGY